DRAWVRHRMLPLIGVEPDTPAEHGELFTAWRTFLEHSTQARPTVLLFEDLHWADEAMVDFLEYLTEPGRRGRMLVGAAGRPEFYDRWPQWTVGRENSLTVRLGPLSAAEAAQLISSLLAGADVGPRTVSMILERTEGNPLYLEEFVRLLIDRR